MYAILSTQMLKMMIFLGVGFALCKADIISQQAASALSQLLLYVILPCVVVHAYLNAEADRTTEVLISLMLGAVVLLVAIIISRMLFREKPIDQFCTAFSNAGFFGIPLVSGVLGPDAVIYVSGMVALLNILQWSYGQHIISRTKDNLFGIIKNPLLIAFVVGILLLLLKIPVSKVITETISAFAACNAPVAMVILGISVGNQKLLDFFTLPRAYVVSAVRLLLIPVMTILIFCALPSSYSKMKLALVLAASAPVGSNVVVYTQRCGIDSDYSSKVVCLSTLLSLVSMPSMMLIAQWLWKI